MQVGVYGLGVPRFSQGMHQWITDRPPSEADGDGDGDVLVRQRPRMDLGAIVHFSLVGFGTPWRPRGLPRSGPAAETEAKPVDAEPAPKPAPEPSPQTRKVPRGFLAIVEVPKALGSTDRTVVAIATDHTAWIFLDDDCHPVEPLPDREELIDAA